MHKYIKPKIVNQDGENVTLDIKHSEVLDMIQDEENKINDYKSQIKQFKKHKQKSTSLSESLDYSDKISHLQKNIRDIKKKRKQYYLENSKYIFQYFEKKQSIAKNTTSSKANNEIINQFFNLNQTNSSSDEVNNNNTNTSNSHNANNNVDHLHRYLGNINEINVNLCNFVYAKDICTHCNKGENVLHDNDGILICTNCSKITKYIIEHEKPSYKEPPKEVCFYAYKRINHFREILAQFQAKESTQIPDKVFEDFKSQIQKERIAISDLTNQKAKDILKKLHYSKYYEHVPFIKDKIGIKPPVMDSHLEETLCNLFLEIQAPYAKYCPDYRVNFLNYYYTIYKLCELLGEHRFLEYFPMLKDKTKRIEQDSIWKNICKDLNWKFIPTL